LIYAADVFVCTCLVAVLFLIAVDASAVELLIAPIAGVVTPSSVVVAVVAQVLFPHALAL
jgi:hypothetical protein